MPNWGHGLGIARENSSGSSRLVCGGSNFPGGTVTDIKLHCIGWGGTGNLRVWVYSDTDSDPTNASLEYDTGNLSITDSQIGSVAYADKSFTTDFGQTINFSLPAGPVYIVVGALDHAFGLGNAGQGTDFDYLSSRDQSVSALFSIADPTNTPDPFPAYSSGGQAEQIMVQLVYTASGGAVVSRVPMYYKRKVFLTN